MQWVCVVAKDSLALFVAPYIVHILKEKFLMYFKPICVDFVHIYGAICA